MNEFKELLGLLEQFRDERDWGQFHDSKNLALALSIEAAELNELFLWKIRAILDNFVSRERRAIRCNCDSLDTLLVPGVISKAHCQNACGRHAMKSIQNQPVM